MAARGLITQPASVSAFPTTARCAYLSIDMSALRTGTSDRQTMKSTDDKRSEYPSDQPDLRKVPLAQVPALSDRALQRLVSEQLTVASFNSAI
jgi:hypothetical protein